MPKASRGSKTSTGPKTTNYIKQLKKFYKENNGAMPQALMVGGLSQQEQVKLYTTIDDLYDYSDTIKLKTSQKGWQEYDDKTYKDTHGKLMITNSTGTHGAIYPKGKTESETNKAKEGAKKFLLFNMERNGKL